MDRVAELSSEEQRRLAEIAAEAERRERDRQKEYPTVSPCCDEPWYKSN
jgi:hypothetical protein